MRGWTALLNVRLLRQFFKQTRRYSYAIFHCGVLWTYVGKYHRFQYTNGDTTAGEATDAAAVNSVACPIIRSPTIRYVSTQTLLNSLQERTNETEQAHDTAEDLHDENLHEQVWVGSVCERSGGTGNTNRDTAKKIAYSDSEAAPKQRESWTSC